MNTGKFAALCGVEKRTLFHYDEINLLKPAKIKKNGYREYRPQQIHDMDMIKIFQSCGYTLSEIKEMFSAPLEERVAHFQKGAKRIESQILALEEMKTYLKNKQLFLEEYEAFPVGSFHLSEVTMFYDIKPLTQLEDHFFSFIQDGTYSSFIFNEDDSISLCKKSTLGSFYKKGEAITFFMNINATEEHLKELIKAHLDKYNFEGEGTYYVENLPHFLLEDSSQARLKIIVFKKLQ